MNKKSDQSLLGAILLIIGIYTLINHYYGSPFGYIQYLVIGAALLLLYHTKRKVWALVVGIPVTAFSVIQFFPANIMGVDISGALILMTMSVVFLYIFFTKSTNSFLITGGILFWIAVYIIVSQFSFVSNSTAAFLICLGFGFLSIYKLGKNVLGKWALYIGLFFILFGILSLAQISIFALMNPPVMISILLILSSIYFIKSGLNK